MEKMITDPIFRKEAYVCHFCKMMELQESRKRDLIYQSTDKLILEEIKRLYNPRKNLLENWEVFNLSSKLKLSVEKYSKIVRSEVDNIKEQIKKSKKR